MSKDLHNDVNRPLTSFRQNPERAATFTQLSVQGSTVASRLVSETRLTTQLSTWLTSAQFLAKYQPVLDEAVDIIMAVNASRGGFGRSAAGVIVLPVKTYTAPTPRIYGRAIAHRNSATH
ncbi:hypothetical protein NDK50_15200 [Paraburkholderia bryophila]|nr:hypothetical protein [Paraburkholderia bryophila]WCM22058.1 hypothetical protein NDK50_15200 [Paraburkholderia bryophila]